MRALFLVALLASAAAPALAAPRDHDRQDARAERQAERAERQADRADRPQRAERPQRVERPAMPERQVNVREVRQVERVARPERQDRVRDIRSIERVSRADSPDSVRNWRPAEQRIRTVRPAVRSRDAVQDFAQRRVERQAERRTIRDSRDVAPVRTPQMRQPRVSRVPAPGTQPPPRVAQNQYRDGSNWRDGSDWRDGGHDRDHHRWNGDWRNDHRYDWRHYRDRNRSIFRIGVYFDPFGWNYQRYNIGWRLWPSYYSNRYWINDPYMYRLPYAPPGLQWIRYYDDALLVDTWDGQVVDVLYNFFW